MKLIYLITSIFCISAFNLVAQHPTKCSTHERYLNCINNDPSVIQKRAQLDQFTGSFVNERISNPNAPQVVINIPVVIHVLYQNTTQNISATQINSQITVLNQDFSRTNPDASSTPSAFLGVAANTDIQFCLATIDPSGNPTTGIERRQVSVSQIGNGNAYYNYASGGLAIWDRNKYLNIWVCDIDGGGTLGYAYLPSTTGASDDGVVIDYRYFGTTGTVSAPFDLGRTATHEVGHWFNLEHIWADEPNCTLDDGVTDTPQQKEENYGCPSYPQTTQVGGRCNTSDPSSMFMNYMDYSDDNCMNIFTTGQKNRMLAAINGPRVGLLTSTGCGTVSIASNVNSVLSVSFFPNPNNGQFEILFSKEQLLVNLSVFNSLGEIVFQSYYENKELIEINLNNLPSGVYFAEILTGQERGTRKIIIQ